MAVFERVREGDIAVKRIETAVLIVSGDVGLAQIEHRTAKMAAGTRLFFRRVREYRHHRRSRCGRSRFGAMCGTRAGEPGKAASNDRPESSFVPGFDENHQARRPLRQLPLRAARPLARLRAI